MKKVLALPSRLARLGAVMALMAVVMVPVASQAESKSAPAAAPSTQTQQGSFRQLQHQFMRIRADLTRIEGEAVKKNPQLLKMRDAFRQKLAAIMKKGGVDVKDQVKKLASIGKQLQVKNVSSAKRQELLHQARQVRLDLFAAEHKAMQNPGLQAMRKKLQEATLKTMREIDSNTDKLLAKIRDLEVKIVKLHSRSIQG